MTYRQYTSGPPQNKSTLGRVLLRELFNESSNASLLAASSILLDNTAFCGLVDSSKSSRNHLCSLVLLACLNGFLDLLNLVLHGAGAAIVDELLACADANGLLG